MVFVCGKFIAAISSIALFGWLRTIDYKFSDDALWWWSTGALSPMGARWKQCGKSAPIRHNHMVITVTYMPSLGEQSWLQCILETRDTPLINQRGASCKWVHDWCISKGAQWKCKYYEVTSSFNKTYSRLERPNLITGGRDQSFRMVGTPATTNRLQPWAHRSELSVPSHHWPRYHWLTPNLW